jgi:excisionase family DNA binding protein
MPPDLANLPGTVAADAGMLRRGYTPAELARLLRVSADRIRAWIKRGELGAINTAPSRLGKPRFVVLPHHLEEFERKRRAADPAARPAPRRRRVAGFVDFFPD